MKKNAITILILFIITSFAALAHADLENFLGDLNAQAKDDPKGFGEKLGNQFGLALQKVHGIIDAVENPADAFMVLQLGQMTEEEPEKVLETYERNKGKGWGVIAKEMGIKPGSPEFHALKEGDFKFTGEPDEDADTGQGKGKGKGKDKDKGKGKGKGKNK
jgi:hypothetical protein